MLIEEVVSVLDKNGVPVVYGLCPTANIAITPCIAIDIDKYSFWETKSTSYINLEEIYNNFAFYLNNYNCRSILTEEIIERYQDSLRSTSLNVLFTNIIYFCENISERLETDINIVSLENDGLCSSIVHKVGECIPLFMLTRELPDYPKESILVYYQDKEDSILLSFCQILPFTYDRGWINSIVQSKSNNYNLIELSLENELKDKYGLAHIDVTALVSCKDVVSLK